jgi:hypothetical protein
MRPVEFGESLVPGTGLTLIRKKLKRSFVLLRAVSYEDVPKKEQAWFGLKYCSYAVRDKGGAEYMVIANNRQPQSDDINHGFFGVIAAKVRVQKNHVSITCVLA